MQMWKEVKYLDFKGCLQNTSPEDGRIYTKGPSKYINLTEDSLYWICSTHLNGLWQVIQEFQCTIWHILYFLLPLTCQQI